MKRTPPKTEKRATKKKPAARAHRAPRVQRRADFGTPIESFFAKQSEPVRSIADALRALVEAAAPKAEASLKWGMPFYTLNGQPLCGLGAHKAHVNLILAGPPGTFEDPQGLLSGSGKTGRHLKVTSLESLPRAAVRRWLRAAVQQAKKG